MRRSTSRFRKSRSIDPRRLFFPVFTAGILATGAVFYGCQLSQPPLKNGPETSPDGVKTEMANGSRVEAALAALDSNVLKLRAPSPAPAAHGNAPAQPAAAGASTLGPELGDVAVSNCDAAMDPAELSAPAVPPPNAATVTPASSSSTTQRNARARDGKHGKNSVAAAASANASATTGATLPANVAQQTDTLKGATRAFKGVLRVKLHLTSPFGEHAVKLTTLPERNGEQIEAAIDGQIIRFTSEPQAVVAMHNDACKALKSGGNAEYVATPKLVDSMRDWLQRIAPDCEQLKVTDTGWACKLPGSDPEVARQELEGISTTMIRRWSRQPYLLARRLAVGRSLARALGSPQAEKQLNTFCNVIKSSLPVELPATMSSKRWQRAVCGETHPQRIAAASFGLNKTVSEIDFLRQLFERTSRLGSLAVKLPKDAPNQVWISLSPGPDVAENLARETAKLWGSDMGGDTDQLPRACWHPVYGEDPTLMHLARNLTLAGDAGNVDCEAPEGEAVGKQLQAALERYFAESITSETEFILPNGRAKTLRLPSGTYNYVLRSLPENPNEWDEAVTGAYVRTGGDAKVGVQHGEGPGHEARGQIVWDDRRPRPVITAWQ